MKHSYLYIFALLFLSFSSCLSSGKTVEKEVKKEVEQTKKVDIAFSADSAYSYIEKQCSFGPRVLESKAHDECVDFMVSKLKEFGGEVEVQKCEVIDWEKKKRKAENVIAHFGDCSFASRIVLFSHYDSRPYADKDLEDNTRRIPIDGANDGASGVGVILEIARQWKTCNPKFALDVVFFDAEDLGEPSFITGDSDNESWCLGSQYWAVNADFSRYGKPSVGILLDMVGDNDARFCVDYVSGNFAGDLAEKVWRKAKELGYSQMFRNDSNGAGLIDDHFYVNKYARIPTIDIIDYYEPRGGFPETWHTHSDNMENISKTTLEAVGKTVLAYIMR